MRKTIQLVVFLKNFATGVMAPVLALVLMAHGATIGTLSLMIGAYSLTVIVAEFPSGVFADLCGRRTAFLVSAFLFVLSYCLILGSQSAFLLVAAMLANGLGRAFSSGSLDALAIDEAEALAESPALLRPMENTRITCWVGGNERAEFLRQNALLANIWTGLGATTATVVEPDRHHFSIIDGLADAGHALTKTLLSV